MILQSLLYIATKQQPVIRPATSINSPWWQAITNGDSGRGLPNTATQKSHFVSKGNYWVSGSRAGTVSRSLPAAPLRFNSN
jgi:hypothetical protein